MKPSDWFRLIKKYGKDMEDAGVTRLRLGENGMEVEFRRQEQVVVQHQNQAGERIREESGDPLSDPSTFGVGFVPKFPRFDRDEN